MSKILVLSKQQLKCNFCTNWFTTSSQFAKMQKHSLNICPSCLKDFNYQIIDSQSYQIYHLFIINTGIKSNSNFYNLQQKYHQIVNNLMCSIPRSTQNKPIFQYIKGLEKYNDSLTDLYSNISQNINKIKDHLFSILKNYFDQISCRWNQQSQKLNLQSKIITDYQEKMYQNLKSTHYSKIIQKLENLQLQKNIIEIQNKSQKLKSINQQSSLFKSIHRNIFGNSQMCLQCLNIKEKKQVRQSLATTDLENKENICDLSKISMKKSERFSQIISSEKLNYQKNLKVLRDRCLQNKINGSERFEKINHVKSSKNLLVHQPFNNSGSFLKNDISKKLFINISQKNQKFIGRQTIKLTGARKNVQACFHSLEQYVNNQNQQKVLKLQKDLNPLKIQKRKQLKKNQSQKTLVTFNGINIQKRKNIEFDLQRQKVLLILNNKIKFNSYLPFQVQKEQKFIDKQWGNKCMASAIIKLKKKTIINQDICQLVSKKIRGVDFSAYLRSLQWRNSIKIIRMVKVGMNDYDFDFLLYWLRTTASNVNTLVITNNFLTEVSLQSLTQLVNQNKNEFNLSKSHISEVYMGNNYIKPSQGFKIIQNLKQLGIQVHI